ncbi:E3 SUMO-protein ligase ZBED1-like [Haliotis cracherodii]|uniref:E3 SUMO-protein ligase ZBED1-like n=1 Tax=Haliotis cracherodii TaxID=6455 RepID=UPI0039E7F479
MAGEGGIPGFVTNLSGKSSTRALPESLTGQNIAAVLVDAIEEWKLATVTMPSLVTDNAANMFVAAREAHFDHHITCFAHTLNLACSKALKIASVSKLLARMRRMVSFFHRSTTAAAVLKQKQKQLNLPNHKLINDCPTRWNSAVEMTERYLEQQPAVIAAMTSKELRDKADESFLSDRDITQAEELLTVLQPLKVATVALCEEKVPTVSIILQLQRQLLDHTLALKPDDSEFIKSVKRAISGDLSHRYSDDKVKNTLVKSALLDPRFQTGPFIQEEEKCSAFCQKCQISPTFLIASVAYKNLMSLTLTLNTAQSQKS